MAQRECTNLRTQPIKASDPQTENIVRQILQKVRERIQGTQIAPDKELEGSFSFAFDRVIAKLIIWKKDRLLVCFQSETEHGLQFANELLEATGGTLHCFNIQSMCFHCVELYPLDEGCDQHVIDVLSRFLQSAKPLH